jgi:hypothetical protein
MKKSFLILVIAGFLLIDLSEIQAQTTQEKPNQVELMKQFFGNWEAQWADTVLNLECIAFGTGIEGYYNYKNVGKDKIILEGRQLWGYDSRLDKYVVATLEKGKDIWILACWFTSNNKYLITSLMDISDPDKASFKVEGEIKSPDTFIETWIMNGKVVITYGYKRVK